MKKILFFLFAIITMAGCTKVETTPEHSESDPDLTIEFDDYDIGIMPGGTVTVDYTIKGAISTVVVKTEPQNGWLAEVRQDENDRGTITVTAPDPLVGDKITVIVNDGDSRIVKSTIDFVPGAIFPSKEKIEAPVEGGIYEMSVNTNLDYTVCIPDTDKGWISLVPQTKSMRIDNLAFALKENKGILRHSNILLKNGSGLTLKTIEVIQNGKIIPMVITVNGVNIPLIKVEGGTFTMGATSEQGYDAKDSEKPAHQVTLSEYYIGQFEVTQELWVAVTGSNPSGFKDNPKHPVEQVAWKDIVNVFLPKLNELTGKTFTLPTEAQWEFAARGGNNSQGYKYSGSNNIEDVAWYGHKGTPAGTKPVGQKLHNELGIYDMSGNVQEWCLDWFGRYSPAAQIDPRGGDSHIFRVIRGGDYLHKSENCRVSHRNARNPDASAYDADDLGFRLVLSDLISFNKEVLILTEGQSESLTVYMNGLLPVRSGLTLTCSDPAVARVEPDGKVTALGVGTAIITARANDTGKEAFCKVNVVPTEPSLVITANQVAIPLIKVEGGTFTMGAAPDDLDAMEIEKPAHQVTLSSYFIGQTEVTQELWYAVMHSNPSDCSGHPDHPVEQVSWADVVNDFLPKLNALTGKKFTLPTEAQWEFAARGGNRSQGYRFSGSNNPEEVSWSGETFGKSYPVAQKLPNELGIYDMSGNVSELCSDRYGRYSAEAQTDPTGAVSGSDRIYRGGFVGGSVTSCRISKRSADEINTSSRFLGFRLVMALPTE